MTRNEQLTDYAYDLPAHLIAQAPTSTRSASRLLHMRRSSDALADHGVRDLPALLARGDLLVVNDTRVLPARMLGRKLSGGRVELLLERVNDAHTALVQMRTNRKPKRAMACYLLRPAQILWPRPRRRCGPRRCAVARKTCRAR